MANRIKKIRERIRCFCWKAACVQLEGVGVIEIILILVIIIGLVLIFRKQIVAIIQTAFSSINSDATSINEEITIN
jgi:hypothetical protein